MKIAMLTNNYKPFVGGVPISVERQAEELVKLGHEVTVFAPEYEEIKGKKTDNKVQNRSRYLRHVLTTNESKTRIETENNRGNCEGSNGENNRGNVEYNNGIRIIRFRTGKRCMENGMVYPRFILREITDIFAEETFDLIHTHHPMFVGPTALYLGRKYQIPVVYTYHTRYEDYLHYLDFFHEDKRFSVIRKWVLSFGKNVVVPQYMRWFTNRCDLVLAPTAGMLRRIRENGTYAQAAVFPTGLEEEFYLEHPQEAAAIREKYLPQGGVLFTTVGRLEEEKNPEFLLEGIVKLKEKCTCKKAVKESTGIEVYDKVQEAGNQIRDCRMKVLIIGDGSMRDALEHRAEEMGIADVVQFLGNISNEQVNRYLQASDLFLFASKSETQGIVLAEAFAAGCPIVAVDASGVEDIVENGVNGFKTAEDVEEWSDKVLEALAEQKYMRERAKITAAGYRSTRLAVYEELLYGQCIAAKMRGQEEEQYEYEADETESFTGRIFRVFKTS